MAATDSGRVREEGVNVLLAQLLRARGLPAQAERRTSRGAPDIRLNLPSGDQLILECKWEWSASALDAQLDERLKNFPEALGVIGVLYPDRLRQAENTNAAIKAADDLRWRLHGSHGSLVTDQATRTGSAADLADHLRLLPLEITKRRPGCGGGQRRRLRVGAGGAAGEAAREDGAPHR